MTVKKLRAKEIIEVAKSRFLRYGYKKTTLEEIAGDIGLVKSAIYKYFSSKEGLINAFIEQMVGDCDVLCNEILEKYDNTEDRLRHLLHVDYDYIIDNLKPNRPSLDVWHEIRPIILEHMEELRGSFANRMLMIIKKGIEKNEIECEDPEMIIIMLTLLLDNLYEQWILNNMTTKKAHIYIDFLVDTIFNGITKRS